MQKANHLELKLKPHKRINLRIDPEMAENLNQLRFQSRLTRSALIRIGIRNLMDEVKQFGKVELGVDPL